MILRPRGGIDVLYVARCGYCQQLFEDVEMSRKEARDTALARGWRKSVAFGWLCPGCNQPPLGRFPSRSNKKATG